MIHNFKQTKRCQSGCYEHAFILQPKKSECWIKNQIQIDYCPVYNEFTGQYENIIPQINFDRMSCLPAFILEIDKAQYQFNIERYQCEHQLKIEESTNKKQKMLVPKPSKKHRYCGVCKTSYEEYLDHIKSLEHINNFNSYRSVNLIRTLITGYHGLTNNEFSDQKQSSLMFYDSNTKMPMNKDNFVAYCHQERIGVRFQKSFVPEPEPNVTNSKRGRVSKSKQPNKELKKVKAEEVHPLPVVSQYHPGPYMDWYCLQQQYLQRQQQLQNPPFMYCQSPQFFQNCKPQSTIQELQYYNQNYLMDQQCYQNMYQQQQNYQMMKQPEEIRDVNDRNHLWQQIMQLSNQQLQYPQQSVLQLVHNIIESYENNPQYQKHPNVHFGNQRKQQ